MENELFIHLHILLDKSFKLEYKECLDSTPSVSNYCKYGLMLSIVMITSLMWTHVHYSLMYDSYIRIRKQNDNQTIQLIDGSGLSKKGTIFHLVLYWID
jgi:hypothetical protein